MPQADYIYSVLYPFVDRFEYAKDAAAELGISKSYLSRLLSGERIGVAVARKFGYIAARRRNGDVVYIWKGNNNVIN